jgi:hypothetical protein
MPVSLRRVSPGVTSGSPTAFHAPLFYELVARLDADKRHVVLDLGAASTSMLALLGETRCHAEIADLAHFDGISRLNSANPGEALSIAAETLLPNRRTEDPIDLVFCWDLPNYLTLEALSELMVAIGHRARPGAHAHALVCYADLDMKAEPGRLVPIADGELIDMCTTSATSAAPRYSPEELNMSMGRFIIERSRLLSNGMQEFLFRLEE